MQMANFKPEELGKILARVDRTWFTELLKGKLYRYVVAFTDNIKPSHELLAKQANKFDRLYDSLTIWWRINPTDEKERIDIWTSCRNLQSALKLAKLYKQHSIRDTWRNVDIEVV